MKANAVSSAVLIPPSFMGTDNTYVLETARSSAGAFLAFCRVDPYEPAIAQLLGHLVSSGCKGIRLTFTQIAERDRLLARALKPFWAAVAALHLPVSLYAPFHLEDIPDLVGEHEGLTVIIDHLGAAVHPGADPFVSFEQFLSLAASPRVFTKLSAICETSTGVFPFHDIHGYVEAAIVAYGPERVAWGSNYPVAVRCCSYTETLTFFDEVTKGRIDAGGVNHILGGTMRKLMNL
jgi:L-fuconolactonase